MTMDCDLAAHITPEAWAEFLVKKRAGLVPPFCDFTGKPVASPVKPRQCQTVAGEAR